MSIRSEAELEGMRAVGRVVALALAAMKRATGAGITTGELAAIGGAIMCAHGARSALALASATLAAPSAAPPSRTTAGPLRPPMAIWPPTTSTRW